MSDPTIPDLRHRSVTQYNIAATLYNRLIDCVYEGKTKPAYKEIRTEDSTDVSIAYIQTNTTEANGALFAVVKMTDYINQIHSYASQCSTAYATIGV